MGAWGSVEVGVRRGGKAVMANARTGSGAVTGPMAGGGPGPSGGQLVGPSAGAESDVLGGVSGGMAVGVGDGLAGNSAGSTGGGVAGMSKVREGNVPGRGGSGGGVGRRFRSFLLLAGSIRATELDRVTRRGTLSLPLKAGVTLFDHWLELVGELRNVHSEITLRVVGPDSAGDDEDGSAGAGGMGSMWDGTEPSTTEMAKSASAVESGVGRGAEAAGVSGGDGSGGAGGAGERGDERVGVAAEGGRGRGDGAMMSGLPGGGAGGSRSGSGLGVGAAGAGAGEGEGSVGRGLGAAVRAFEARDWMRRESDPRPYRGTAGLLRDLVEGYDEDDVVVVAPARRVVTGSLVGLLDAMEDEDVAIFAHGEEDTGIAAVRVGALRLAKEVGFDDFREQFLPRLMAAGGKVRVREASGVATYAVRSVADYVRAVRAVHEPAPEALDGRVRSEGQGVGGGDAEGWDDDTEWRPRFLLREAGVLFGRGSQAFDSVLLSGAVVEEGAVLGRCVVGPGGVVPAGAKLLDMAVERTG